VWSRGEAVVGGPQKLKQFADIVYRFRLQRLSTFENVAQGLLTLNQCVSRFTVKAKRHFQKAMLGVHATASSLSASVF